MNQWFPYLLVLVCPVSMGVMMWLMMRGQGRGQAQLPDSQVAKLESEIKDLRATLRQQGSVEQNGSGASSVTADRP